MCCISAYFFLANDIMMSLIHIVLCACFSNGVVRFESIERLQTKLKELKGRRYDQIGNFVTMSYHYHIPLATCIASHSGWMWSAPTSVWPFDPVYMYLPAITINFYMRIYS